MSRLLTALVRASVWRPWATVVLALLLAIGGSLYTVWALDFITSPLRLLPQRARYVTLLNEYLQDFAELDDIIVAVEAPDPRQARRYADRLVETLRHDGLTSRITYRIDPRFFDGRGLLYLPLDELTRLRERWFDYDDFIRAYAARPTLVQLLEGLNRQFANAMALGFLDLGIAGDGEADVRFLDAVVDQIMTHLEPRAAYVSPWDRGFSFGSPGDDEGYYFSSDNRLLFLFFEEHADEGDFASNRPRIEAIRRAIGKLAPEFAQVRAGVTGGPTIADDEMATAIRDSALATALAAILIASVLLVAYRRLGTALLLLTTLALSLACALGLITLVVGHLSVFSVMFLSLVIGVGIDYGIYFLYRYQEECALGASTPEALERAASGTGPGMLLGALTAAGTFLVLMLTDFRGIREFGLVSALAILMAFLSMLTLLPALLALASRGHPAVMPEPSSRSSGERLEAAWLVRLAARRTTILALAGVFTAVGVWGVAGVTFDHNMLKLQAAGVESVLWEARMLASAGRSGFAALTTAGSLEGLRRKRDAFARLSSVSEVESVLQLVPDAQPEKIQIMRQLAPLVASVRVAAPPVGERPDLRTPLLVLRRRLALAAEGIDDEAMRASVQQLREKIDRTLARLPSLGPEGVASLGRLESQLYQDFRDKVEQLQKSLDPEPIRPGEAPPELRSRYVGRSGRYLLRIQPAVNIWQEAGSRRFIEELRTVDPDVTGPPVTNYEATHMIQRGYYDGTAYAFVLVALVTFAVLRTVRGSALALAPVALGVLWTLGLMRVIGLPFNLANVWALPLIVGTAAEYGVNIYMRFIEGARTEGPRFPRSVILGVILSWLTTIAGFGSLMVAHHCGIFSLGLLLTVGSTASLLASVFVLPVLIGPKPVPGAFS
jgi:uncharacterized protein